MATFDVRILDDELDAWDRLVGESPAGTVFHTTTWLDAATEPCRVYGCYKGEELLGGMATASHREGGLRKAVHPALTPYLGMVTAPQPGKYVTAVSNEKKMAAALADRLQEDHDLVRTNFAPETVDLQPFIWEGFDVTVGYTYRLDISDLDAAWDAMDSSRRRDVRSAEKEDVRIEEGTVDDVLAMVRETFERKGRSVGFDRAARDHDDALREAGRARAFVARDDDDRRLAAAYLVWDDKRAYYLLGGHDGTHHGAMAATMWDAIRTTAEEIGLEEFDFEGSMDPGVERFFRKWGGQITPYFRASWANTKARLVQGVYDRVQGLLDPLG